MIKLPAFVIILFISFGASVAQPDSTSWRPYKTWIIHMNKPLVSKGIIHEVKDSSLVLAVLPATPDVFEEKYIYSEIGFSDIETIKIRKTGSKNRGAMIGVVVGTFIAGAILTKRMNHPYVYNGPKGDAAYIASVMSPVLVLGGGIGLGILLGSIKLKIPIHGSYTGFHQNKIRLTNYTNVD